MGAVNKTPRFGFERCPFVGSTLMHGYEDHDSWGRGGWESINKGAIWAGPGSSMGWLALMKIQLEMGILHFRLGLRPGFNRPSWILISLHGLYVHVFFNKGHLLGQSWFSLILHWGWIKLDLWANLVESEPALLACRLCFSPHDSIFLSPLGSSSTNKGLARLKLSLGKVELKMEKPRSQQLAQLI